MDGNATSQKLNGTEEMLRAVADPLRHLRIGGVVRQQLNRLLRILPHQIVLPVGKVASPAVVNMGELGYRRR